MDKQPPCFDPPRGGWFRGIYISKESIQDMLDWCNPPQEYVEMLGFEMNQNLIHSLKELIDPEALDEWLKTPNESFGGESPMQLIVKGETGQLWEMIYRLESGEPA